MVNDPVRFAMVGAGWWANLAHLPAMRGDPAIDLVAVMDADGDRAARVASRWGAPAAVDSIEGLLAIGGIECAVVATPHTTHRAIVERLLEAGIDVLVEKPMATTATDAWAMVDTAARLGRILTVGLTYQYAATAFEIRSIVTSDIGELVCVNAEFSSGTQWLFAADDSPDDPELPHGTTYSDPALSGGGQGQTQLTHLLGNLLWTSGSQPDEVFAYLAERGLAVDLVDALAFRLEGGTLGTATSTGTTPPGVEVRHRIRYHGTRGMVEHDLLAAEARVFEEGGAIRHIQNPVHLPPYDHGAPVRTLARLARGQGENPAPPETAAASAAMIEAAYTSARDHAPVRVSRRG